MCLSFMIKTLSLIKFMEGIIDYASIKNEVILVSSMVKTPSDRSVLIKESKPSALTTAFE